VVVIVKGDMTSLGLEDVNCGGLFHVALIDLLGMNSSFIAWIGCLNEILWAMTLACFDCDKASPS
jgi:hypothetical protein